MATQAEASIDQARAEAFAGEFLAAINGASVVALASLGNRTGLFDVMANLPPSTSQQIAERAGLQERYVREWLGGMVLGRIVEYDPTNDTYQLPAEHAAFLTTVAGPNNLATLAQVLPYLGLVEDAVVDAFRNGGGVPYSSFPHFQDLQKGLTGAYFDAALTGAILPMASGIVEKLQAGAEALDIGTGAGHAVNVMAVAFPKSKFAGYDLSSDGIVLARNEAADKGLKNVRFETRDVSAIGEQSRYDLVTAFEFVHDLARPEQVLRSVYDALKPGGTFLVVDMQGSSKLEENMNHPVGPLFFACSVLHCMTVSLAQGGAGLGTFVGEQKLTQLLGDAGFSDVSVQHMDGDFFYAYYVARKD